MKILAADGISPKGIALLQKDYEVVVKDKISADELLATIGEYDAIMVRSASKVTAEVIKHADKLKIIGRAGVGVDNIDIPAATERGIVVINSPGGNTIAATEHTMAMMLALSRNIPIANETMQKGEWNRKKYVGVELRGKTLGVIGMGRIGSGVAKRALAFEMNVIGYDPYINKERAEAMGVKVGTFDEVIENADFITVHMPLNKDTKGMIGAAEMKRMKKGVRLINCARGGIITEPDLAEAVKSGQVAGAAIDVYTSEPVTLEHPLVGVPGIILTPHLGASTVEAQIGVSVDVAEGIKACLTGQPVMTAVNMAPVSREVMSRVSPFLSLAERLGVAVFGLSDGPVKSLEVTYQGDITDVNTTLLTTAVTKGYLSPVLGSDDVNYVNAPSLAKGRSIEVSERKAGESKHFENLISVKVMAGGKELTVSGTLFGTEARIVRINKFRVDVDPHARILVCPHVNEPGIIGAVGTVLGGHGINISGMEVGKTDVRGTSLMVLNVDSDVSASVLDEVKGVKGINGAILVDFDV